MIEFKLNPFTLALTNVHTLQISLLGSPYEVENEGEKLYLQRIYYKLIRHTEEDQLRIAEEGNKDVPAELSILLLGQLTGTLTEEQKVMIETFLQTFNSDITLRYEN